MLKIIIFKCSVGDRFVLSLDVWRSMGNICIARTDNTHSYKVNKRTAKLRESICGERRWDDFPLLIVWWAVNYILLLIRNNQKLVKPRAVENRPITFGYVSQSQI